jgi:uncharacterized protein (TIGR03083 family)
MTTVSKAIASAPRPPALERVVAMRLAAAEYDRFLELVRRLQATDWDRQTECAGWDVRAMVGHVLGMAEMEASLAEQCRQFTKALRAHGVFIDALTALQVAKHRADPPDVLVARFADVAPKAVRGRRRTPGFVRRRTLPVQQSVSGVLEQWTFGFLVDVILTRDTWMHRMDLSRALAMQPVLTADHDGLIVADVVREWAGRHGQPCALTLTGAAGGAWTFGVGGPALELDAVEFCRLVSGRGHAEGLLAAQVPF